MALFSECSLKCARKVLDTADIVREAILRQQPYSFRLDDTDRADVLGSIQRMILRWSFEKFQSVTWSIRGREQQLHFSRESNEQGIPASVVEPGQVYAFRNVIINPVAVP